MSFKKEVWCDGACFPNPGPGGWGWTCLDGNERSGFESRTTNNRMELMAVIDAIKTLKKKHKIIHVYSDSQYVVNGITKWIFKWKKMGFKDVKNSDLWIELHELRMDIAVTFEWIRGHSGNPGNEKADRLATEASGVDQRLIEQFRKKWE